MRLNSENALARAVRAAREEAGLSQQEVADRAGMSRVWVARLEGGAANVTLDSLLRVASVVGMSLDATWDPREATKGRLSRKRAHERRVTTGTGKATTGTGGTSSSRTKRLRLNDPASKTRTQTRPAPPVPHVDLDDVLARVTKR